MKWILIVLLLNFFSKTLSADTSSINKCMEQADYHGKNNSPNKGKVDVDCFNIFKKLSVNKASKISTQYGYQSFGHKSLLFVRELKGSQRVMNFSGDQAGIEDIFSVSIDDKGKFLAVLANEPKVIMGFHILNGGNRQANYINSDYDFREAVDIAVIGNHKLVAVLEKSRVLFFNQTANTITKNNKADSTNLKFSFEGISNGQALTYAPDRNMLIVFDRSNKSLAYLRVKDSESIDSATLSSIASSVPEELEDVSIQYFEDTQELLIRTSNNPDLWLKI